MAAAAVPEAGYKRGNPMKKILTCLLAVLLLVVAVSAQAPYVDDASGLLTPAEAENLETQFSQLYAEYGVTVAVVTAPTLGGETAAAAAKNAYESNGYGNDGIMLYICEDEGEWYLYTSGLCSQVIPDSLLTQVGETVTEELQAGSHYEAIQAVYQATTKPVIELRNDNAAKADQTRSKNGMLLILGLVGGLMAGVAAALALRKLSQKPIFQAKQPEPAPEPVPPVFEVQIPDLTDGKTP